MQKYERTITAICTPQGIGAIGIIRISGSDTISITDKVFCTSKFTSIHDATPNMVYHGNILSDKISESCLMVYFKAPKSYTGEDVVELYCHGGVRLLSSVLELILFNGATLAENGEFTKRAFMNGKMALSDAEGVIDLINAESEAAINAGYRLMSGQLSSGIRKLTEQLLIGISGLEVALDYPEELEEDTRASSKIILIKVLEELKQLYSTADSGKIIKNGINVAIIGAPNVGKSSLLNAILRDERAIVSEIPGTTRDTITESIIANGIKINFIDTAGIRESEDDIEKLGVLRTFKAIDGADIIIKVIDATTNEILDTAFNKTTIEIYNKSDLRSYEGKFMVSAKNGQGIDDLINEIIRLKIDKRILETGEILTSQRHIDAIRRAIEFIEAALAVYDTTFSECLLVDINAAYIALGEIDGSSASEKIIDDVFSRFCVGK